MGPEVGLTRRPSWQKAPARRVWPREAEGAAIGPRLWRRRRLAPACGAGECGNSRWNSKVAGVARLGGCLNAERPSSASRAGEGTQVPGAAAPCSLHRAPWHVWQELAMEPQVSRAGVVSCQGQRGRRPAAPGADEPHPGLLGGRRSVRPSVIGVT